jgi:glycosyltransferase XagB
MLPALIALKAPVPLGGTSMHIRVDVLKLVGGWDPHNVTEDADLGIRLHRFGFRTALLDSVTYEEANSDFVNWVKQRSRWYKGYLQTMLVHLRNPVALRREIGTKATLRLINMTGGVPITSALNIVFWFTMVQWVLGRPAFIEQLFPPVTYYLCLTLFLVGTPVSIFMGLIVTKTLDKPHLWWAALLMPPYWILQSIAALKAGIQLVIRPSYWEKTVHGLDRPHDTEATAATSS